MAFLDPLGTPPTSAVCAFYRWLETVCSHDWNEAPLVVSSECQVPESHLFLATTTLKQRKKTLTAILMGFLVNEFAEHLGEEKK
jgi:hypothetical protein